MRSLSFEHEPPADAYLGCRRDGRGPYVEIASGTKWYILQPHVEDVKIEDIAASLAKTCRFTGHTKRFYSVAQHCVMGVRAGRGAGLNDHDLLHVLLHDAAEAYLGDVSKPLKSLLPDYKKLEAISERVIAARYGLTFPWPAFVKQIDDRLLVTEQRDLMPRGERYIDVEPYEFVLDEHTCWDAEFAEKAFRTEFWRLTGGGA